MKTLNESNEILLSREEYKALIERIEDLEAIIKAYETENEESYPWSQVKKELEQDV